MDKQAYEQRVQSLAEKMARTEYEKSPEYSFSYSKGFQLTPWDTYIAPDALIERKMGDARIAVAEMAEIAKAVFLHHHERLDEMNDWLKKRGLIPDNAQEGVENDDNDEEEKEKYCIDCGNTDLAYITQYANGEEWRCKECGKVFIQ